LAGRLARFRVAKFPSIKAWHPVGFRGKVAVTEGEFKTVSVVGDDGNLCLNP